MIEKSLNRKKNKKRKIGSLNKVTKEKTPSFGNQQERKLEGGMSSKYLLERTKKES